MVNRGGIIILVILFVIITIIIVASIIWLLSLRERGACCINGTCTGSLSNSDCVNRGGIFQGKGTSCSNSICTGSTGLNPVGACCIGNSCQNTTQSNCLSMNGFFNGAGTNCSIPNICSGFIPTGSCCLLDGNCQVMQAQNCFNSNGIFSQGNVCPSNCSTPAVIIKLTPDLINPNTTVIVNILDVNNPNNVLFSFNASNQVQTSRQLPSNVNINDYVRASIMFQGNPTVTTNLLPIGRINQCFRIGPFDSTGTVLQTCS